MSVEAVKAGSGLLDRTSILQADDIPTEDVLVEEWGGMVRVRGMTAGEAVAFSLEIEEGATAESQARVVRMCLIDETGAQLFTDEDVAELAKKNPFVIQRLWRTACALSGLTGDTEKN